MLARIPLIDRLRVGTRLFSLVALALIAIGAATLLFSVADRRLEDAFSEHAAALKIQDLTHEIAAGIGSLRSHQTAFLAGGDVRAVEAYSREAARLRALLETLAKIKQAGSVRTDIDTLHDGLAEHAAEFRKLADLGVGENGVAGRAKRLALRTQEAAAELEDAVKGPDQELLAAAVLTMRGFERRYLAGNDSAFVQLVSYRQEVFDPRLAAAELTPEERAGITSLVETYMSALSTQAKWLVEQQRIFARLDEILGYLTPAVEALGGLRREAAATAAATLADRERIRTLMLAGAGAVLLFFAGLGGLIARSVSRPLRDLADAARHIAAGDRDAFVPVRTTEDEIGDLARGLRAARDSLAEADLRGRAQEHDARSQTLRLQVTQRTLVEEIETEVAGAVALLTQAAADLARLSEEIGRASAEIAQQSGDVSKASQSTATSLRGLTGAASRLHNAIGVAEESLVAMDPALPSTEETTGSPALMDVAWDLRAFLERVANIALRTRLMALRGAIAGGGPEAQGVADEIRELTDRIAADGIDFSDRIKAAVAPLADVAAAIDLQGAAAREILINAEGAVSGTLRISNAVSRIGKAAADSGTAAGEIKRVADAATQQSEQLRRDIDAILSRVRRLADL